MLLLKPNCEFCNKDLPADSTAARICSYECTFCDDCVTHVLENVCPNCGGGFSVRPIRPKKSWRNGVGLAENAASQERVHSRYSNEEVCAFAKAIKHIAPESR